MASNNPYPIETEVMKMKVQEIENVIQWYISALKKAGIKQFAYSNGVLHMYPNELTDEQYEKCDIISEFIIIKHMVRDNENRYDIKDYLEHAECGVSFQLST